MPIQLSIKEMILAAQNEASEVVNAPVEMLRGIDKQMEHRSDGALYYLDRIWVPLMVMLVPSCFVIFDLEPLSLSLDF
ncbi:hypothetical protein Tco_0902698, partial [Tanacetum coccineum]